MLCLYNPSKSIGFIIYSVFILEVVIKIKQELYADIRY